MEAVEENRSCGDKCSMEMKDLCCKPKARCFKGLMILCGIYSLACGVMLMIIPPVVNAHGYDEATADGMKVHDNVKKMTISSSILLIIFVILAIVNFGLCKVFERKEAN